MACNKVDALEQGTSYRVRSQNPQAKKPESRGLGLCKGHGLGLRFFGCLGV